MKRFALIGVAEYVAPRHLNAIKKSYSIVQKVKSLVNSLKQTAEEFKV